MNTRRVDHDALREWTAANARARYAYRTDPFAGSRAVADDHLNGLREKGHIPAEELALMRAEVKAW